jgi:predicted DNA-binding transcriptional regulator AlpA
MTGAQPQTTTRTNNDDRLWSIGDVSRFLGIPVNTLYQWRHHGVGPRAYRVGRHLRYDPAEIRRWLAEGAA